jgi:hypothetical protein
MSSTFSRLTFHERIHSAAEPQPNEKRGHGITLKHTEKVGKKSFRAFLCDSVAKKLCYENEVSQFCIVEWFGKERHWRYRPICRWRNAHAAGRESVPPLVSAPGCRTCILSFIV